MKNLYRIFCLALIFQSWNFGQVVNNPPVRWQSGTAAPSSGACDAAAEVGGIYLQTGDPASVRSQAFVCQQTGASTFAWEPFYGKVQDAAPTTCSVGDLWFDSNATAGSNLNLCTAANTWTAVTGGGGISTITTPDTCLTVTDPTGPTTDIEFNPACPSLLAANNVLTGENVLNGALVETLPNSASTGTVANSLVSFTDDDPTTIIRASASATNVVGLLYYGAGTTGNGVVIVHGFGECDFDGATTAGNYVQASATAPKCTDVGATLPTTGGQVLGQVKETIGGAGLATMYVNIQPVAEAGESLFFDLGTMARYEVNAGTCALSDGWQFNRDSSDVGCNGTSEAQAGLYLTDTASDADYISKHFTFPAGVTIPATMTFSVIGRTAATSGTVILKEAHVCYSETNANYFNPTYSSFATSNTVTATSTTLGNVWSWTIDTSGCSANQTFRARVTRDSGDTMADWAIMDNANLKQ